MNKNFLEWLADLKEKIKKLKSVQGTANSWNTNGIWNIGNYMHD